MSSPPSVIVASADPPATAATHFPGLNDTIAIRLTSPEPLHYQTSSDAPSFSATVARVDVTPDPAASVQHVSLSGLSDISHADKVLLQALGVPDSVAYAPTAPAAISTVIQSGAHTAAVNGTAGTASSPEPATPTASTDATPHITPETINVSAPSTNSGSPGAASPTPMPDIATVMQIILKFELLEAQPTVLLSDHGAIFYDAAAINTQYSAVKSVTYDFGDGFSISLVGLPVELTHAGAHV
jgi:hypothetical protein